LGVILARDTRKEPAMTPESRLEKEKRMAASLRAIVQLIDEHCQGDEKRVKTFEEYAGIDFALYKGGAERASLSNLQQERLLEVLAEIMREKNSARRKLRETENDAEK
jgi:hypothetical protein